jgi:uncharacterized NAD(P)/FAD-binding protein YdhS
MLLRTIVIVGGGFSGVAVAAQLLRRPPAEPTRLILIERAAEVGRGAAYTDRKFPYLLNVPASRMSACASAPNQFLEFAQRRIPNATGEDFLPRALYGEYLREMLLAAELSAPRHIRFEILKSEVVNIRRIERHVPLQVELHDGVRLTADDVVLALGNPAPSSIGAASGVLTHSAYIEDPWTQELQFDRPQNVMLIGTGSTAVDVINRASNEPLFTPTLHAVSRHGLVPPRQTAFRPDAFKGDGTALLHAASRSLTGLTGAVRLLAEEAERCGGDWREAITFVRNTAPTIWQSLPHRDRVRFLRHLRAHWDVHRHRLPPQMLHRVELLKSNQRLHIHAGRIQSLAAEGSRIQATWKERHGGKTCTHVFDWVVNCTGPDYDIRRAKDRLWKNLLQCGLCIPDALGLGLRTGPKGAVIDADGWPGPHLFYVGPMLRADYWESTAVGELRVHAQKLAAVLRENR